MRPNNDTTIVTGRVRSSRQSRADSLLTEGLLVLFALLAIGGAGVVTSIVAADTEIITRAHGKIISAVSVILVVVAGVTITVGALASAALEDWKTG